MNDAKRIRHRFVMVLTGEEMRTHVFIIESPKPMEILLGQTEGEALDRALCLTQVTHKLYRVVGENELDFCIEDMVEQCKDQGRQLVIVHLSMHGDEQGIWLTSGEHLSWSDLRDKLMRLAEKAGLMAAKQALLTLCFSVCHGLQGERMNDGKSTSCFLALVGSRQKVSRREALTAFVVFYHNTFLPETAAVECVRRMNAALGSTNLFEIVSGEVD